MLGEMTQGHLAEDLLEKYALGHLSGEELDTVEEHLLLCPECQERLQAVDDFIRAVRLAAPQVAAEREGRWWGPLKRATRQAASRLQPVHAGGVLVLALALAVFLVRQPDAGLPRETIRLDAMRGGATAVSHAGRLLAVELDAEGLLESQNYTVQWVDLSGGVLWQGEAGRTGSTIRVEPHRPAPEGASLFRVSDRSGTLLREYTLSVKAASR